MGKASRWLKGLLGSKKEKEQSDSENKSLPVTASNGDDRKEKRRRSFAGKGKDSGGCQIDLSLRRSYNAETEVEQSKHAIAVAAATAAAADAAVVAAHAAVAVVRLTSNNRATPITGTRGRERERSAALLIQCVFRGYLARKALRALRALVKLQALVRGFLVRKRTSVALSSMEALLRAQMIVQLQRTRRQSIDKENRFQHRRSYEKRSDDSRTEFHSKRHSTSYETAYSLFSEGTKIVEVDTYKQRLRSRRINNAENLLSSEWSFAGDEIKFSTAHNTPRLQKSISPHSPATPARSVSGEGYLRDYSNFPNYMSSTQSYMAKLRSNSAPKQRPELGQKRMSLSEIMGARKSLSGIGMHRPVPENQEDVEF